MKCLLLLALLPLLAACAGHPVATFTAADATTAATMAARAAAAGDQGAALRVQCWAAWNNLAEGVKAIAPGSAGVMTNVEAGMEVQTTLQSPACKIVASQVMLWALRRVPGIGSFVP